MLRGLFQNISTKNRQQMELNLNHIQVQIPAVKSATYQTNMPQNDSKMDKFLVAAIDLGTAYSGYAFSFRSDYKTDPLLINTMTWSPTGTGTSSYKTPTAILLNSDKSFNSFGYEAEERYAELTEKEEHASWYYFRRFKMNLHDKMDIKRNMQMDDIDGKSMPAVQIFSLAIGYLKKHLCQMLEKRNLTFTNEDIHWVITVPAIWTDAAKQFMREAAELAGIKSEQVTLAYEPEAAAVYCRAIHTGKLGGVKNVSKNIFDPPRKVMVLDLGGGTVDISVQQMQEDGKMSLIHRACGGAWGGTKVDEEFQQFLYKLFGYEVIKEFIQTCRSDYLDILRDFEIKKRKIKSDSSDSKPIKLPAGLDEILVKNTGFTIKELIPQTRFAEQITIIRDKMFMHSDIYKSFFQKAIDNIVLYMEDIFSQPACEDLTTVIMVGGFSESPIVNEKIRQHFPEKQIIVPTDAGVSVLKGAVLFGHNPGIITARACRYTYGVALQKTFNRDIHPREYACNVDGNLMCDNCFEKFFTINQMVNIGDRHAVAVSKTFESEERQIKRRNPLLVELFVSPESNPMFITDKGCRKLGEIVIMPRNGTWPKGVDGRVELEIAGTEIVGRFVNDLSGEVITGRFEVLQ